MFCARCGQQIPDHSLICPLCGRDSQLHLQTRPEVGSTVSPLISPAETRSLAIVSVNRPEPKGVGGWLLFFCITLTILWPLWIMSFYALRRFTFRVYDYPALLRHVLGILAGILLWMQRPTAMIILRIYYGLGILTIAANVYIWLRIFSNYSLVAYIAPLVLTLVPSLAFMIFGVLYFSTSLRVRGTFGKNLF